jgi:hypothetical protein
LPTTETYPLGIAATVRDIAIPALLGPSFAGAPISFDPHVYLILILVFVGLIQM